MSAVKVAISQDFMMAFSQVPKKQQKKVMEFVNKFRQNPQSTGINYEKINDAKEKAYRSVRIDQDYRGIVLKPENGNVFLLLWVDKHDDAYNWARRHACEINAETGALQIFESSTVQSTEGTPSISIDNTPTITSAGEASTVKTNNEEPLFKLTDEQFIKLGLPSEVLPLVRAVRTEAEFESIESRLPMTVFEPLYLIAAGSSWEDIEKEYVNTTEGTVDTSDIETALTRPETLRFFHVIEDELELKEMLEAPLEHWRVFLHPSQRKLVSRDWNGPVRVLGGAGTGKTVVAMHRAKWLAQNIPKASKQRILFTTFTANLAIDIQHNLRKICSSEELARIEVKHIDKWVSDYLKGRSYPHTIVYANSNKRYDEIWTQALQLTDPTVGLPDSFYKEEWDRIILPNRVSEKMEYFKVSRKGRGVALNRKQRSLIWPVFEELRTSMHQNGLRTFEDATLDAADSVINTGHHLNYSSIVIDEGQDMGPEALTLIRQLVPEQANDLFIVGDGHQRIYRRKTAMSACGIKIVGRSRKLKINYRTTEQTRKFAMSILENIAIDDLDGNLDSSHDYRSLTQGESPNIQQYNSIEAEAKGTINEIKLLKKLGVELKDICIVARINRPLDQISSIIKAKGIETHKIDRKNDNVNIDGIRLATMHRVKGLEFRYVFIISANEGLIPLHYATSDTEDPVEARQRDLNERALLHVACTRAIKHLFISSSGSVSSYMTGSLALIN
jgi:superfamily I DNA/RNA helicase/mRNA-degrading endonuclease RelE of RelBE toxin-antitoxin system